MRKKRNYKRTYDPDTIYGSITVARFINYIMEEGKKSVAEKVVYKAFDILKEKTKKEPLEVFEKALENVTPQQELQSRRVGGAN